MTKWLTFDLDGTLMQNPFVGWVFPEIEAKINDELKEEIDVTKLLVDKHHARMKDCQFFEAYDWDNIVAEVVTELQLSIQLNVAEIVKKHCVDPKIYLLEDHLIDSLKKLKIMGYSLAVVTNGYFKYQFPVMKALGIADLFDKIITPEDCRCAKPSTGLLEVLLEEGDIVAHIGDRIDHDVVMANELGVGSVFINRDMTPNLKEVSLLKRNNHKIVLQFCEEKWRQEIRRDDKKFTDQCVPDVVIYSIDEFVSYLGVNSL